MLIPKNIAIFLLLLFFWICNEVHSTSAEFETLIQFKKNHAQHINDNDIKTVCIFGDDVWLKTGIKKRNCTELIQRMQAIGIPQSWLDWFKRTYSGSISYKTFAAAIFYPYEVLETTHKTHLSHMNYAFKASIMYSSQLDPHGIGRAFLNALSGTAVEVASGNLLSFLDIGFITCGTTFMDKALAHLNTPGVLDQLLPKILSAGTSTQVLNLGLIFKNQARDDDALRCFDRAISIGSQRAFIEKGNILLKRNFTEGVQFFSSLSLDLRAYGLWKIAQCYRYGIYTDHRNPDEANRFYLQALATVDPRYPEILYDAADFAVEYAYAQPDAEVFKKVIHSAIMRLQTAGEFHLGLGYLRAAELSLEVAKLFPEMADQPSFCLAFIISNTKKAFMEGQVVKAGSLLKKMRVDDTDMIVMRGHVENIDRNVGF